MKELQDNFEMKIKTSEMNLQTQLFKKFEKHTKKVENKVESKIHESTTNLDQLMVNLKDKNK